ncbi:MAG: KilA-N domain-containing protein [Bacteroidia bacterium]
MTKLNKLTIQGQDISIKQVNNQDYISLTDMVRNHEDPGFMVRSWLRNRSTVEFLGVWETNNNNSFNYTGFDIIRNESGSNTFILSVKRWIDDTNGIGLISKAGKYGGTFAHIDIAVAFGYWISPTFQYYLIKEFQRLEKAEAKRLNQEYDQTRLFTKVNYTLQTKAIQERIEPKVRDQDKPFIFSNEADMLNLIVFGMTARQWRECNPDAKGNIPDHASILELNILNNLQARNAELIDSGVEPDLRYRVLLQVSKSQFERLKDDKRLNPPGEIL